MTQLREVPLPLELRHFLEVGGLFAPLGKISQYFQLCVNAVQIARVEISSSFLFLLFHWNFLQGCLETVASR